MTLSMIRRLLPGTLLAFVLLLGTAACTDDDPAAEEMAEEMNDEMDDMEEMEKDLVAVAVADGRFTTLAGALQSTGLDATLQGDGPFTVFAPTDDAFAKLPEGTLAGLSQEELTNILTYHVASGKMMASEVAGMSTISTAQGSNLAVTVGDDGTVRVNDAIVVVTDVAASNGVIHVIDSVLMPPADDGM